MTSWDYKFAVQALEKKEAPEQVLIRAQDSKIETRGNKGFTESHSKAKKKERQTCKQSVANREGRPTRRLGLASLAGLKLLMLTFAMGVPTVSASAPIGTLSNLNRFTGLLRGHQFHSKSSLWRWADEKTSRGREPVLNCLFASSGESTSDLGSKCGPVSTTMFALKINPYRTFAPIL